MLVLLIIVSVLAELGLNVPFVWRLRKPLLLILIPIISSSATLIVATRMNVWALLIALISAYRIINLLRILKARMHEHYLRSTTLRTTQRLDVMLLFMLVGLTYHTKFNVKAETMLRTLVIGQLIIASFVLLTVLRNIYKSRHLSVIEHYSDKELPTLTVAVPARDETNDLDDCLRSILANDYPKIEVLVLDDCSQEKPSDIIKKFAHDGVRFIRGSEPSNKWLPKNQAYDRLADEASGDLVLFCGVDVRFGPQAIRALVTTMLNRDKSMISVLPRRLSSTPLAGFIQPMRYWWELALPRRMFNRPPVLSTCWLIKRRVLRKLGGFEAVSHSIIPEGFFARQLTTSDSYSFIRANNVLDIQTLKSPEAQRTTAIRTRYPQLRRRPENVLMLLIAEFVVFVLPFILLIISLWSDLGTAQSISLASCILFVTAHICIVYISNPANVPVALFNFPLMVLTEVVLMHQSMVKYEFATVDWKGRNVCYPVMHVIAQLPNAR